MLVDILSEGRAIITANCSSAGLLGISPTAPALSTFGFEADREPGIQEENENVKRLRNEGIVVADTVFSSTSVGCSTVIDKGW